MDSALGFSVADRRGDPDLLQKVCSGWEDRAASGFWDAAADGLDLAVAATPSTLRGRRLVPRQKPVVSINHEFLANPTLKGESVEVVLL